MKNLASLVVSGLALVGIGTIGYRSYKLKQIEKEQHEAEKQVEAATDDSRE